MSQASSDTYDAGLLEWEPARAVRSVDPQEVRLSRGFLRCRPERWFPGFPAHWLPLAHSLGVEIKVTEVKPALYAPRGLETGFACSVDDEPLGIFLDDASTNVLLEAVTPGSQREALGVVAEYLARRLLVSLESSWSGPESSVVRFETEQDPFAIVGAGAVKVALDVHGNQAIVWLVLGKTMVDRFDGLWRRQVKSASKGGASPVELQVEVAQLVVPPATLVEYLKEGNIIDLEVLLSDQVTLRVDGKAWMPARLCSVEGRLGFEVIAGPVSTPSIPEGTTRLSIVMATVSLDSNMLQELGQVGAFWDTGVPLSNTVQMLVNKDKVSEAKLCSFEGRFAISVL